MKKFSIFLSVIFGAFIWFSFAAPTVLNPSYDEIWNDVKVYWTDNSNGWYVDINVKDPKTNDWLHFGEVEISKQVFTYTKQREWTQEIQLVPGDGWDVQCLNCSSSASTAQQDAPKEAAVTRTVIPAVPKTGPSGREVWVTLAIIAVLGGYIYIKRKADL